MGLISWIKNSYYDHRLNKADECVANKDFSKAEAIYRELLGKQPQSVVHLAKMLVANTTDVSSKLNKLKELESLRQFMTNENRSGFYNYFQQLIDSMDRLADIQFAQKNYAKSVSLLAAIIQYRKSSVEERYHKSKAYNLFSQSQGFQSYVSTYADICTELEQLNGKAALEINNFKKELLQQKRYCRIISLLQTCLAFDKNYKKEIVDFIVKGAEGSDSEKRVLNKISDICNNGSICADAADVIATLAIDSATRKDYKKAVSFDALASEYKSSDNSFNNNRCSHLLEEASGRADASELSAILGKAKSFGLSKDQIAKFIDRIEQIAKVCDAQKSIEICRLFLDDKRFNNIYIDKSLKLVIENKIDAIRQEELLSIIKKNNDKNTLPDVLSKFVNKIGRFEKDFYESAIRKIKDNNEPLTLFEKYWDVKPNECFLDKLIDEEWPKSKDLVSKILLGHGKYLSLESYKSSFYRAIRKFNDEEYLIACLENAIVNGCDVNAYFIEATTGLLRKVQFEESIVKVNHYLSILPHSKIYKEKIRIIRGLISISSYDLAEEESRSLVGKDAEANTLLAETFYAKGLSEPNPEKQKESFYKVLKLDEENVLASSFETKLNDILHRLSGCSLRTFDDGDIEIAFKICSRIERYQEHWLPLFIELKEKEIAKAELIGQKIKIYEDAIDCIVNKSHDLKESLCHGYTQMWSNYSSVLLLKTTSQPKDKAILSISQLRSKIYNYCPANYALEQGKLLTSNLVKLKWSYAIELEEECSYSDAIIQYKEIAKEDVPSYKGRASLRALICILKRGEISKSEEQAILNGLKVKSFENIRADIAYRYAVYLLQSTRPSEAESILREYLPDETELLGYVENVYIRESEGQLTLFNAKIQDIQSRKMTSEEAVQFLAELDSYAEKIGNKLTDLRSSFSRYKSQIDSYILGRLFNEEKYDDAFTEILELYPDFIENDDVFRNLAIASLGILEDEEVHSDNAKYAISVCLSAIFTDRLFVRSLDYTCWDDEFTFSLYESLGNSDSYEYDEIPENVVFDELDEDTKNVQIKDVQNNLIIRLETAVRNNYPELEDFCSKEKSALESLMALRLDESHIIAAPYLTQLNDTVSNSIKYSLDYDFNHNYDNKEDVLSVGICYGFRGGIYANYENAKNSANQCISALSGSATLIRSCFANVENIRDYSKLFGTVRSAVSNAVNNAIKAKEGYKVFLDKFEPVCKALKETTLSLTCTNYVNGLVRHELIDNGMKFRDGIGYLVRLYNLAPSNIQVTKDLEAVIEILAKECEESNNSSDVSALNKAIRDTGSKFRAKEQEGRLQGALNAIVDKVNNNRMQKYDALNAVHQKYIQSPNNDRVCENLVTLIEMCIGEYIIGESYMSSYVSNILDQINNNKSATFRTHARKLATTYHSIWDGLDPTNQMLMMGLGALSGRTLNSKGLALKEGLEYFRKLGSVPSPSAFGRRNGLFDNDLPF